MNCKIVSKPLVVVALIALMMPLIVYPQNRKKSLFDKDNLVAWCIVPFDNQHRNPAQRIQMLKDLGFTKYAYDWRTQHVPSFDEEISLANSADIKIVAVWLWIDKSSDRVGQLSDDNEQVLKIIKESGLKTKLWVGFNNNFFADEPDDLKVTKGVAMLNYLRERTSSFVEGIGLYNHGDWFGEPENQIKILKQLNSEFFGLIYNFHHGHHQMDSFSSLVKKMKPYLWTVNINGMKKDGPQILSVGSGDRELEMLKTLEQTGFHGTIGILGHIEDDDVEKVLQRNLAGLDKLKTELK